MDVPVGEFHFREFGDVSAAAPVGDVVDQEERIRVLLQILLHILSELALQDVGPEVVRMDGAHPQQQLLAHTALLACNQVPCPHSLSSRNSVFWKGWRVFGWWHVSDVIIGKDGERGHEAPVL